MKFKIDGFVAAIIVVIAIAYMVPQLGRDDSPLPLDTIGSIGVSLIFFFYGLKLSREKLVSGLKNWKLHVLVQSTTFLLFPLIVLVFLPFVEGEHAHLIWLAFLFLAALPSTVSSSVVMVSIAKGNIPAAIFNASISGLVGIVITPLWMGLFIQQTSSEFDLSQIYLKLTLEILGPVLLGIILQRYLGKYVQRYSKQLSTFDKSVILLIIYRSFAESFDQNIFGSVGVIDLLTILFASLVLFFSVYSFSGYLSRVLRFTHEDQITAQFCGTKKSLIHGTVFSKILFQNSAQVGILLLPLMMFHAMQIFIISIIASKKSDQGTTMR
ncbi:bile acid:sodium symporter family protein [Chryseolinea sp. T2]|uniref:bile acid:sodium symporter family protein n=1 Tax=Chryseolinea sp. T2 TaxID=3129255 RepID=UPI00307780FB